MLPAWKGRQIAERTIPLTGDAASWVDAQVAPFVHKLSLGRILRAVDAAVLRFDPEEARRRADAAAERRGVWVEDHLDGTTSVTGVADTPDAVAFDTALNTVESTLGVLGDPDSHPVRRAKALGILADPQYALTLLTPDRAPDPCPDAGPATGGTVPPRKAPGGTGGTGGPVVRVHLHIDALTGVRRVPADSGSGAGAHGGGSGGSARPGHVARVTGVRSPGPRPVEAVERWPTGLRPDAVVAVTPVVDLTAHHAVDAYEVPARIAEQIEHRDLTCRFPWCNRSSASGTLDKDHIRPYRFHDPDQDQAADPGAPGACGGRPPPGQTATLNLALLCRFHHRIKTHGGWTYRLTHDTVLTWTSPLGRRYSVDENGTRPLS